MVGACACAAGSRIRGQACTVASAPAPIPTRLRNSLRPMRSIGTLLRRVRMARLILAPAPFTLATRTAPEPGRWSHSRLLDVRESASSGGNPVCTTDGKRTGDQGKLERGSETMMRLNERVVLVTGGAR